LANILTPAKCQGNSQEEKRTLEAALAYAQKGHSILACKDWPEKSPHYIRGLLERGHLDATSDERKIEAMFARYPDASLGLRLEHIVVVDVESKEGHGVDGYASLRKLEKRHGVLPDTWVNATPSSGEHRLYRAPEGVQLTNRTGDGALAPGVEFKASGYVLVPPSPGYSVKEHRQVAELPDTWVEFLAKPTTKEDRPLPERAHDTEVNTEIEGPTIPELQRNTVLTQICGRLHDGSRNLQQLVEDLKAIRDARCENPRTFPDAEVEQICRSIYKRSPCRTKRKAETPEVTARLKEVSDHWYEEHLKGGGRSKLRDTYRACCVSAAKRREMRTVTLQDGRKAEIPVFSESTRQLSETVRTSHVAIAKHLNRLVEMGALVPLERPTGLSPTYGLLAPAQGVYTPQPRPFGPENEGVDAGVNLVRVDELETPMFAWHSPVGNAGGGVLVVLEAFGPQSSELLAGRLGTSRVRDLERRRLEPLERMGLVERRGGVWGRPEDFRERDDRILAEPYTTVFRRRQRRRTAEGRKVCQVIEMVRMESELERDLARREQHAGHRREFEERREKALREALEADRGYEDLLNRWDEDREADGFIGELERIGPLKPEPEAPELSELAIALRDFLALCPHMGHEQPSWLANYVWSEELVGWKPTKYEVADALGELAHNGGEAA
jgi:hypothetical protein